MGNLQSLDQTGRPILNKSEIERMERRLKRLGHGEPELAFADFKAIPEVAGNPFLPRLFEMADGNCDGYLCSRDLQALMLRLIELKNPAAKCQFAFEIFDADGDGLVTADDLYRQLSRTNSRGLEAEQLTSMVHATLQAFDADNDGALNFPEFVSLINSQPIRA